MARRLNRKLFGDIADAIEKHPERYDQQTWCGTAYCLAGWAVALHYPDKFQKFLDDLDKADKILAVGSPEYSQREVNWACDVQGRIDRKIPELATRALGIPTEVDDYSYFASTCTTKIGGTASTALRAIAAGADPAKVWGHDE